LPPHCLCRGDLSHTFEAVRVSFCFAHTGLWFASPAIAWWISRPLQHRGAMLTTDQTIFLRKISRKTWGFFETFVGPEDHWLPPDSYQEDSVATIAHRTSPTNMGLALLANLSAYDFGYIPAGQLIERTANAIHTMEALERYRGHFYNWYDTQSLKPLPPLYISSVDSGNLAAHLLTLRQVCSHFPITRSWVRGCLTFKRHTRSLHEAAGGDASAMLADFQNDLASATDSKPATLAAVRLCLDRLATSAEDLVRSLDADPRVKRSGGLLHWPGNAEGAG